MKCSKHKCDMEETDLPGVVVCPQCMIDDNYASCHLEKVDRNRNQFINGRQTCIIAGDQYRHRTFGTGTVQWINPNPESNFPIKMYFREASCYAFFNVFGKSTPDQDCSLIEFPTPLPIPETFKLKNPGVNAVEALRNLGRAFKEGLSFDTDNKWDIRFMELAKHIAGWSKDPSTKVGAVIIDRNHRIVSVGFNGYPQHIPDDDLHDRERKYAKIIHAEMNAILFSQKNLEGCEIFVWPMAPCSQCASALIQSGIERVVTIKATKEQYERWGDKIKLTEEMFLSANVDLEYI